VQITLKLRPKGKKDPVQAVRDALGEVDSDLAASAQVEEVFPGVKSGNRAGMVVVRLPADVSEVEANAVVTSLKNRADVLYAEPARPRKAR
jgi:hypothetical protein